MSDDERILNDEIVGESENEFEIPDRLPLLPVRDIVVFPYMILPLSVGRDLSVKAVNEALASDRMMMLVTQKNAELDNPEPADLYKVGTVVTVMRMIKTSESHVKILVQGLAKATVKSFVSTSPFFKANIKSFDDEPEKKTQSVASEARMRMLRERVSKIIELGKGVSSDILTVADGINEPGRLADLVASNLNFPADDAQKILETTNPDERLNLVNKFVGHEIQLLSIQEKIENKTQNEMTKSQRDYYLREQMRQIQKELGESDDSNSETSELMKKVGKARMPETVDKEARKQINRLDKMHSESAEATTVRTYIDCLLEVPWSKSTVDSLDIKRAKKVLDEDHYDLEKVKERILEYLGVAKLKKDIKGPILCLLGPPGTGKTSLGKSIARALGRKFTRMSLGGVRDEAEIRGHRRTYVGAMPGRIIQGLKTAGSNNPVFMLDEIDKLGADFRGDPTSALLEVLDPEQNFYFADHYLTVPFDLSKVLFIATANSLDPIPSPLRDRMEILTLSGYTEEEKLNIAKKYIIPKQVKEHGMTKKLISFNEPAIRGIINSHTREAGLRNLERTIATVCRKVALNAVEKKRPALATITEKSLSGYLGPAKYIRDAWVEKSQVGVATGLAWTAVGGTLMHIEVTTMKGKGNLTITGKLGEVMKESARAAFSYCRANATALGISEDFYKTTDLHIHVPAGAIPKDGPSAGITIAVALASALSNRPISNDIAMTGEITLRGRVLPIGGLKEKTLAALQAGIKRVIIPQENEVNLHEIPEYARNKITFIPLDAVSDVMETVFGDGAKKKKKPKKKVIPKTKKRKTADKKISKPAKSKKVVKAKKKKKTKQKIKLVQATAKDVKAISKAVRARSKKVKRAKPKKRA